MSIYSSFPAEWASARAQDTFRSGNSAPGRALWLHSASRSFTRALAHSAASVVKQKSSQHGFTLIEMLLSVMIISILAGIGLPLYQSFQTRTDLDVTTESVANLLRRGQIYARGMHEDSAWSIKVQSGGATLYKGSTYASRDTSYDENVNLPSTTTSSGLTDVTFAKFAANPSATGTITLTTSGAATNDTRTITLNAEGMVNY